jgi:hypothetical protein
VLGTNAILTTAAMFVSKVTATTVAAVKVTTKERNDTEHNGT